MPEEPNIKDIIDYAVAFLLIFVLAVYLFDIPLPWSRQEAAPENRTPEAPQNSLPGMQSKRMTWDLPASYEDIAKAFVSVCADKKYPGGSGFLVGIEKDGDWHTAEDVVYEIFLEIIRNPHITNLRPQDTFRHTLIVLLKQKHRSVTKPWRKALMQKMATWLHLMRPERDDPRYEAALGYADLVVANLMDESQDGGRPYKTYTLKDLERWRCRQAAEPDATGASVAREQRISEATLSASCKKVNDDIAATVREIMSKRGLV